MTTKSNKETRIIMMSPSLMDLYEVQAPVSGRECHPITFYDAPECLDMLTQTEAEDLFFEDQPDQDRAERLEKQWGELELRLSFFTDALKWQ